MGSIKILSVQKICAQITLGNTGLTISYFINWNITVKTGDH
jgi:hypothetical protein